MSRSNFETDAATSAKLLVVHGLQHAETRMKHDDFWTEVERRMDARRESMGFLPAIELSQREAWGDWIAKGRLEELAEWGALNFDSAWNAEFEDPLVHALKQAGKERTLGRYLHARSATLRRLFFNRELSLKDPRLADRALEQRIDVLRVLEELAAHLDRSGDAASAARVRSTATDFAEGRRRPCGRVTDRRRMDENVFWSLIDASRDGATSTAEQVELLTESLAAFGAREIQRFGAILDARMVEAFHWDLWALAYIARGGCSDDAFSDFRAWLISRGRHDFERSIADLDHAATLVAQHEHCTLEAFQHAAAHAFEHQRGLPMPVSRRRVRKPAGVEWSEDDLPRRFPKLCARFGFRAEGAPHET